MAAVGITNLDQFAYVPGNKDFFIDFFINPGDGNGEGLRKAALFNKRLY